MADVKFKKGLTNALPSTKTEGQVYFSLDDGQATGLSEYTGNLWFDYDSTHRVKINKHADMADKDGIGNNIADTYISQIKQNESTGTTFKFQGYDANDSKNANEISLPLAGDVAGLISNTTQTIKGNKTFSGNTTLYQILSQVKTNTSSSRIIPLPNVPYYSLTDEIHDTETYLKALIKWICENYSVANTIFFGQATPNSQGVVIIYFYDTTALDTNGYPQYARGTYFNLNGNNTFFGFYDYIWKYSEKGYASESDKAINDGIGQNIADTYIAKLLTTHTTTNQGTQFSFVGQDGNGSNNANEIIITGATTSKAGLVTTGAQTLTGIKTFNASGGVTIQGAAKFLYSGIESLTTTANLPIWFGKSGATGTPGYNTNLNYNPSTNQLNVGTVNATKFLEGGTDISSRYLVDLKQEETTGTTYKIRGYDHAGSGKTIISIPLASSTAAGLISNTTQTITGEKTFTSQVNLTNGSSVTSGITTQLKGTMATNDYWRIAGGATASDSGYMEIATADSANEPIYIRQYSGAFATLQRTLTLLDANGNTHIPGILYDKTETELLANNYISTLSNAENNSGTYVGISGSNTNASIISTIQLPNASSTAAGVITNDTQTIAGAKTFTTGLKVSIGSGAGQLLMMSTTYNSMFRNDGTDTHLLMTNSGTESYNDLRPFSVSNTTGIVTMAHGLRVTASTASTTAATGALVVTGGTGIEGNIVNNGSLYVGHATAENALIYLNAKLAFSGTDTWLKLNNSGSFTSGIHCGSSIVRTDGQIQVGSDGTYFYANSSGNGYFSNTLGIAGTNTSFKLYVNGTSRFMDVVTHTGDVNPSATNTYSLGVSGTRWSKLFLGTEDSYGSSTVPVYWNAGVPTAITSYSGNAATATKLQTAREINGTAFDGSADITTTQWGTARTISISATAGTTGTSIDGSANASLIVPSTMTGFASITSTKFVGESSSTLRLASNSSTNSTDPGGLTWFNISGTKGAVVDENDTPTTAWWYILRNRHTDTSNNYYTDLAIPMNENHMYYKIVKNNAVVNNDWVMMYDTQNITYGTNAPNNSDGKPNGSIYIQLIS